LSHHGGRPVTESIIVRTAFVSTYPPRRCGIATFTSDLARVIENREIVALHPLGQATPYPLEVHHRIRRDEAADYLATAHALTNCVDVVSIQHDFRIWGGIDGDSVLDFAAALQVPAVATFHAVLREPTPHQREIVVTLAERMQTVVVTSRMAAARLTSLYAVDPIRIQTIPYGVPDLPPASAESSKPALGLEGREVILSFGLLGPGKGYELAIDAMPAVVATHPKAVYVIVGATGPDLIATEGEAYRATLVARVKRMGLGANIQFVDRFVGRVELTRWLQAADVVVTPFPDLDRPMSGSLSWAMAAGCAIVSTPHDAANELLADGRGILVAAASPEALGAALTRVLDDAELRATIGQRAHDHSRAMVWPKVGAEYRLLLAGVAAGGQAAPSPTPPVLALHA
jgi:glycosyltransferase involved in cell wall biosynthesis